MFLNDYRCEGCGRVELDVPIPSGEEGPDCCKRPMDKLYLTAAGLRGSKTHFSHVLNREATFLEEERHLEKDGSWIASKTEANRLYDTDIFDDNAYIKKNRKENIRKHVEKQAERLVADGTIKLNY